MRTALLFFVLALIPSLAAAESAPDEPTINVPPAVTLTGPTEIPDDLVERLNAYQNTRWGSLRSLSADGKTMLISTRFGGTSQIHVVGMPGGARRQITFRPEPTRTASFVPFSDRSFLYRGDIGGNEQYQVFRFDMDTGRSTMLTDGTSRHEGSSWNNAGDRLAFTSTARNGTDHDIWMSDGKTAESRALLVEADGAYSPGSWAKDDSAFLVEKYVSRTESHLFIADAETGKLTRVTGKKDRNTIGSATFGADNNTLFVTTDRGGEFRSLYRVTRKGKRWTWTPLTPEINWDVEGLTINSSRTKLAFLVNEGGYATLHLLDPATGEHHPAEGAPEGIIYGLRYARSTDILGFTLAGPTHTGDAWTYDPATKKATQWTFSEHGGLDPAGFTAPTIVEFESFDGTKIPCWYYRPAGDGPFPVVVDIHGGPEGQARPYFRSRTQFLVNERATAVLVPNVRGSAGYGKSYLKLDNGFKREDSVKDIGALLDWVGTTEELDAGRVAVLGGSYGGYMVLASLVHYSDRLRAGVDSVGISNFVTFLENTKAYRRDLRRVEYGDERDKKMRAHLEAISPLTNVDQISAALFVGHGANDPRVPVGEAEQIVDAVRAAGHEVWYMRAENEGHGFGKKENRDLWNQLVMLFLEKQLAK
jgi:dipeptidyl aminopeptidase/acylaminoacyl peptidase